MLEIVTIFRLLRLTILLHEMKDWGVLVDSMKTLIYEFVSLGMVFFYIIMIYSVIGCRWFGGKISTNNIDEIAAAIDISAGFE